MKLPKEIKNSQSGQILVIFLLVLVVGLALVLSIASRTVTDVRQSTTSDESNRAYFAAESGVQNALKLIQEGSVSPGAANVNLQGVNRSNADVDVTSLQPTGTNAFEFPGKITKDDVAQVILISDFATLSTAGCTSPSVCYDKSLKISWGDTSNQAAIEVSIVTCNDPCTGTPGFKIFKMAFDPVSARATATNFCLANSVGYSVDTTLGSARDFQNQVTFKLSDKTVLDGCSANDQVISGNNPVLARIRPLYNSTPTSLAVQVVGQQLPIQGNKVVSIGKTPSGVTRKLTATRLYPALPAIFDYVLFNGATTPLIK